ncbi:hypothetical protein J2X72_004274 [Phyllobacterium sp. 1468]|uniref:hypothetical protein n=1 Tax=Phyllobacterium sp. 1468 TaxID=2817759 RepID=UPI001AE2F7C0|nr:hypothetical protein [Phyllobacterium sp. 1468]MDR6635460.1 hypothetical protein [Phyllobacterium sp. 1468]
MQPWQSMCNAANIGTLFGKPMTEFCVAEAQHHFRWRLLLAWPQPRHSTAATYSEITLPNKALHQRAFQVPPPTLRIQRAGVDNSNEQPPMMHSELPCGPRGSPFMSYGFAAAVKSVHVHALVNSEPAKLRDKRQPQLSNPIERNAFEFEMDKSHELVRFASSIRPP